MAMRLRTGLGLSRGRVLGGGAVPLAYTMLRDFDAVTQNALTATANNASLSIHTGSRKVQGTGGFNLIGGGLNASQSIFNIRTFTDDMALYDTVAMRIDLGSGYENTVSDARLRFVSSATNYDYRAAPSTSLSFPYNKYDIRGAVWVSFKVRDFKATDYSGASVQSLGTASKTFNISPINAAGNAATDIVLDAAVFPATTHKTSLCITFDDNAATQYTNGILPMIARGLVGTIFVNTGRIGTGGYMTWAQLKEARDAGFALCLNSERLDLPINAPATRALGIAAIQTVASDLVTGMAGVGVDLTGSDELNHFAYSYGNVGYPAAPVTLSCNPNGTATLPMPNPYQNSICAGMRITGTGVPADCYVVRCISDTSVETSAAITSGSSVSLTFTGRIAGRTRTNASPATVLTVSSTTNMFAGGHILGVGIPTDTRIVSVDSSTQITVDKTVAAGTSVLLTFAYVDGEFWPSKVQDDLIAAGFKSGRRVGGSGYGGVYTGFGLDPLFAIGMPGISIADPPAAAETARIDTWIDERTDIITYSHGINNAAPFATWLDGIVTRRDAGLINAPMTIPAYYAAAIARTFV